MAELTVKLQELNQNTKVDVSTQGTLMDIIVMIDGAVRSAGQLFGIPDNIMYQLIIAFNLDVSPDAVFDIDGILRQLGKN